MKRFNLAFSHPTRGIVAIGPSPITAAEFEGINGDCRPCLVPICDAEQSPNVSKPLVQAELPDREKEMLGHDVGLSFLVPPVGWTPTAAGSRLPNELPQWLPYELANAIAWQLNWVERRSGMERRCWRALIAGGHVFSKWGLLRVDVPKCWRPPTPGSLPPNCIPRAAVVGLGGSLHAAARRFNASQLEAGPVRLWAAILHAPIDPATAKASAADRKVVA